MLKYLDDFESFRSGYLNESNMDINDSYKIAHKYFFDMNVGATEDEFNELFDKYKEAKEAYYSGNPIMGDVEFDELEDQLGLANVGYVGTKSKDDSKHTELHPCRMGSLAKINIKANSDGTTDFGKFVMDIQKVFRDLPNDGIIEVTPKFDGCSWEAVWDDKGHLISVSTRGDGKRGTDVRHWIEPKLKDIPINRFLRPGNKLVIRGEGLIGFENFSKYNEDFSNTRAFVAGMFNRDWTGAESEISARDDMDIVAYDFRLSPGQDEYEWIDYNKVPNVDCFGYNILTFKKSELNAEIFAEIYDQMEEYRKNCKYPLDGFVLKPEVRYRKTENVERPSDCVAIKYKPTIFETTVKHIEWNLSKLGEFIPVVIFDTVVADGKNVNRASCSNYGMVKKNKLGVGSKIRVFMGGDIIPQVHEVITSSNVTEEPTENVTIKGIHLMKNLSEDESKNLRIMSGAGAIDLRGFKEATLTKNLDRFIFNGGPEINTILDFLTDESINFMDSNWGYEVGTAKIVRMLKARRQTLTVAEIILALQFRYCGKKFADVAAEYIQGNIDQTGLIGVHTEIKNWLLDPESEERRLIQYYIDLFGIKFVEKSKPAEDAIAIIMTGSPKDFGYATKSDFLTKHPEYYETTNWKECEILFTDDMLSSSSKMQKAQKLGIEIKQYF